MKGMFALVSIVISLVLILGSSGNFREYYGERGAFLRISDNSTSYIAFECPAGVITVKSGETFAVMNVTNNLNEGADFYFTSADDLIEFSNPIYLESGETATVYGVFKGGAGNFTVPVTITALWANGSALIEGCSVEISDPVMKLEKILISGNKSVQTGVREFWTFRILLESYGIYDEITVKDTIPAEFEIISINASNGNYSLYHPGNGMMGATKLVWVVDGGGVEYIDVTVATKLNPAGKQEFTSSGIYYLNEGAEIKGCSVKSNEIQIEVHGGD